MSGQPLFSDVRDPDQRVRALCEYGCQLELDTSIPPKRYFRTGLEMVRMGNVYRDEGDLESAFIIYSKFITLFVEKLPQHPEIKKATPVEKAANKKKLLLVFKHAEDVKKKLKDRYSVQEEKRKAEEERAAAIAAAEARQRELEEQEKERLTVLERQDLQRRKLEEQEKHLQELQEKARREKELEDRLRELHVDDSYHKGQTEEATAPPESRPPSAPSAPSVDRSSKPDHFTSSGRATTNRHGYRDVVVPTQLVDKFLVVADANTNRNVETCGILAGKLSHHAFRITHLLIPTQSGGPDSCSTDNEEDVFDYQDQHDLITLGWIHTHPSQTAFMSSVDLHTHCSYQLMMPEAVAIVCAPKYHEVGKFSLTADYGLKYVANCRVPGFHPHPKDPPLYEDCEHVRMDEHADAVLVDLRKGGHTGSAHTRI